jgi:hypothetical protein
MEERTGGCLCGQVRYRLKGQPVVSRLCWCRDCQHLGGNGTANAIFPSEAIEIEGETAEYTNVAESGNSVRRRFCAKCGSHLFADNTGSPGLCVVRLGTLHDPSSITPEANIWASSAPAWACLNPSLPVFENQPQQLRSPPSAA